MHRTLIVVLVAFQLSLGQQGQETGRTIDPVLTAALTPLVRNFPGVAGVYVRHLKRGVVAGVQADTLFPTASMIKVPIMCGLFDRIARGDLAYNQRMVYRDSLKYDSGITGSLVDSARISLAQLVMLMITASDNTASLWLQALAGGGDTINAWLKGNGFHQTRVNSRTPGRADERTVFGWGVTTPREMAELVASIFERRAITPDASEEMFRVLTKPYWDGEGVSQVPPHIQVASKSGAVNRSKSEVVLVNAPSGDYVFCVITKDQNDTRWERDNDGYVLIRKVSKLLWEHFEPGHPWQPTDGSSRWSK